MTTMQKISSYVFFDIETTGLPWQERNRTKITELCFVAALSEDIERTAFGHVPIVSKFTAVFNPERIMSAEVVQMTGLSNSLLHYAPFFKEKIKSIVTFLEDLRKPICLVAHNGNSFDFKIFLTECIFANATLPNDLLCVDSLVGFRNLLSKSNLNNILRENISSSVNLSDFSLLSCDDLITDDEDEWPDFNVSNEQWYEIDEICDMVVNVQEDVPKKSANKQIKKQSKKVKEERSNIKQRNTSRKGTIKSKEDKKSYKLSELYRRLLKKDIMTAHRAEADCLMLLECVVALKQDFLPWAENHCKLLTDIKPLVPY